MGRLGVQLLGKSAQLEGVKRRSIMNSQLQRLVEVLRVDVLLVISTPGFEDGVDLSLLFRCHGCVGAVASQGLPTRGWEERGSDEGNKTSDGSKSKK